MATKHTFPRVIDLTKPGTVMPATVSVKVQAGEKSGTIRAMIAWTSQLNLISEKCMKEFDLPLIGGPVPSFSKRGLDIVGRSYIKFSPRNNDAHTIGLHVHVAKKINPTQTPESVHPIIREALRDFELADPFFDVGGDVDLVLGMTFCPLMLKDGRYLIPGTSCYVMESIFGWIVVGRAPPESFHVPPLPPRE